MNFNEIIISNIYKTKIKVIYILNSSYKDIIKIYSNKKLIIIYLIIFIFLNIYFYYLKNGILSI